MEYSINDIENGKEIILNGSFTYRDHDVFENIINLMSEIPNKDLIFNIENVDFIDSAIMGLFVIASDESSKHNITVHIKGANGKVKEIMEEALFDRIFNFK